MGLEVITGQPHIVSADNQGNVRIWDMRNLQCIQSLQKEDYTGVITRRNDSQEQLRYTIDFLEYSFRSCLAFIESEGLVVLGTCFFMLVCDPCAGHDQLFYLKAYRNEELIERERKAAFDILFSPSSLTFLTLSQTYVDV